MCGIYATNADNCVERTVAALKRLEYRGYDSVGICARTDRLQVVKTVGRTQNLTYVLPNFVHPSVCMGHTRWATHGKVSDRNAHPFVSYGGNFAICHNGVLDNWQALKSVLVADGVQFTSDTDSEVIAHMLERCYDGNVLHTVTEVAKRLTGSFAVAILTAYDDNIYFVKRKSPLVIGLADSFACVCSDIRCVDGEVTQVANVPDGAVGFVCGGGAEVYDLGGNQLAPDFFAPDEQCVQPPDDEAMLAEIFQIPDKIRAAKRHYIASCGIGISAKKLRMFNRIYLVGCGTAYHSGLAAAAVARKFVDIDVVPVVASEFLYDNYPVDERTLAFFISQSGETADTVRAAELVDKKGGYTYAVTNTATSALVFACNRYVTVQADAEFAVASTKAYNCQLTVLVMLFADIAVARKNVVPSFRDELYRSLDKTPNAVARILQQSNRIDELARKITDCSAVYFLGRTIDLPTAMEAALKLKEISYMHCEAYPAGELKHGALAMVEKGVAVVAVATDLDLVERMNTSLAEAKTRGADVYYVSPYKMDGMPIATCPVCGELVAGIVSVVPLQLLAYYAAKHLGRDIDKPRNLAKSVTVE